MAGLLTAAAAVIGEKGYESATLTSVADRAGASIGALYQYFPNKRAMAQALQARYDQEMADQWKPLLAETSVLSVKELVDRLLAVLMGWMEASPAYLPLLGMPSDDRHGPAANNSLCDHLAELFREKWPDLTPKKAARMAQVTFQLVKGMPVLFKQEDEHERRKLLREFRLMLAAYLRARLHA